MAERNAAHRNHGPLLERSRQRAERLEQLRSRTRPSNSSGSKPSPGAHPTARRNCSSWMRRSASSGSNDDAAAWAQLQQDLEAADQRLDAGPQRAR